jgi:hypothetical protein
MGSMMPAHSGMPDSAPAHLPTKTAKQQLLLRKPPATNE